MHEFSTAMQIVKLVLEEAERRGAKKVLEVRVRVGKLSFLNPEQLRFSFDVIAEKNPKIAEAKLKLREENLKIECLECGYTGTVELEDNPVYHYVAPPVSCPRCGGVCRIKEGRGCTVEGITIEV